MATEIRLPQFGMGMLEGTIVRWYKTEGARVENGDVLAEVEASKTVEELYAPGAGVLDRILVAEGETVPVHEILALLRSDSDEDSAVGEGSRGGRNSPPVAVTPRARRLASELGVDLSGVVGSGPGGRIGEEDVRAASQAVGASAPPPSGRMRATIAARMHASLQSMAQLTMVTTADVTELVAWRQGLDEEARPTFTDIVIKAASLALRRHPEINATMQADRVVLSPGIHIGMATAVDGGLVVPVIRDADRKSLGEIRDESKGLAGRARAAKVSVEEMSGGTFTVTSLGGQGIDAFTPIINPPEAAILGIGRIVDAPTPGSATGAGGVVWRKVMTLSLTIDHRVIDGSPGAAFLASIVDLLSNPHQLTS